MPARPASLDLENDEEKDIGDLALSSGLDSSATIGPSSSRTHTNAGLGILGPQLPMSMDRLNLGRRVSLTTSDIGVISQDDASHQLPSGHVQLGVLETDLPRASIPSLERWIMGIAIVDFDIDQGPVISSVYPPMTFAQSDVPNIAFSSFPDSPRFDEGSQIHSFRVRLGSYQSTQSSPTIPSTVPSHINSPLPRHIRSQIPNPSSIPPLTPSPAPSLEPSTYRYINGFSYFTQRRDPSVKRGYRQQALVILTPHQYPALFSFTLSLLGSLFAGELGRDHATYVSLNRALMDWTKWPDPIPGERLLLTFLNTDMEVELPHDADEQRLAFFQAYGLYGKISYSVNQYWLVVIHQLWSAVQCGGLLSLDEDAKRPGEAGLVLGVTNPWLEKQCSHWGCIVSLRGAPPAGPSASDSPFVRERTPTGTPTSAAGTPQPHAGRNSGRWTPLTADTRKSFIFGMSPGGDASDSSSGTSGWKNRSYKRYISKDRTLLKKLEDAWKSGNEHEQLEATLCLRQHFNTRTREMLVPLSRYLNTLIPSPAELASSRRSSPHQTPTFTPSMASLITPSTTNLRSPRTPSPSGSVTSSHVPRLKPFSRTTFFASLKEYGCPLPFRSTKQRTDFYERWLKSKTFGIWLAKQEEIVQGVLEEKT
ncbi:hypothetical protein ONZ45_g9013 [Pleurotus djamor]|nr:hypothetical protein ONZ45_g9013 [Pleurotus djamor]